MNPSGFFKSSAAYILLSIFLLFNCTGSGDPGDDLSLSETGYFEATGINYLVFDNCYSGPFGDEKKSGIEIIHHGVRTATNGDLRLEPTPGQWDPIPGLSERNIIREEEAIEVSLFYRDPSLRYRIRGEASGNTLRIKVILEEPLPESLEGKAGFNLEFLPAAYFRKTYTMDNHNGVFPLYPGGPMQNMPAGKIWPLPIASGKKLVLAPGDPERQITVESLKGEMHLFDGRNLAQNGWYVLRSNVPSGEKGTVVEWVIQANTIQGWERPPVISHSQAGYHPVQQKRAVIELDRNSSSKGHARLVRISTDGACRTVLDKKADFWGDFLRYQYVVFDFSEISEEGTYLIEYEGTRTDPFIIGPDVYADAWQPSLDIYLPVQMDHMFVNEAYRVWHGAAHLDD
ncbi:MAG: glycoside hydrolase, partial [Bacteroidales bacterium]|nr:glycoside hydrolase [Bacteroidales bacterium]